MPGSDDRLTRELERVARPASPTGTFERVDRRRARRARVRKAGSAALVVIVLAGTVGGVAVLRNVFLEDSPPPGGAAAVANGAIVVTRDSGTGSSLWVVEPDGTERRLTSEPGVRDESAAVSPDGRTIAFARYEDRSLWVIGIDGSDLRRLTSPGEEASDPAWSPDGTRLVYADPRHGSLVQIAFDRGTAGTPQRIDDPSTVAARDPVWSPDGRTILFAAVDRSAVGSGSNESGEVGLPPWDLYEIGVGAAGAARNLTSTPDAYESSPSISPDGSTVAFIRVPASFDDTPRGGLALMARDGTGVRMVTAGAAYEQHPAWSPDGSLIAFDRDDPAGQSVYTIRPDGTGLTRVTLGIDPAWQPIRSDAPSSPDPSPTPAPSTTPTDGTTDLGFAFPVCNVASLDGDFDGNGAIDTAYVATEASDAGCPQADQADNVLGVDLDGDGVVDADGGPIACQLACLPWVASDLNVDGAAELFVAQLVSPIVGLTPYRLVDGGGGLALVPITFHPPGDPGNDLPAGAPPVLYLGGDEGFAARLECSPTEAGAVLNAVTGHLDSIEQPTTWTVRQTIFRMDGDRFRVLDSLTSHEPVGDGGPFGSAVDPQLCGEPFPPNPVFPPAS